MRIIIALLTTVFMYASTAAQAENGIKILNNYISMKLHLSASNGQMVGASWIRIRNSSNAPIHEVPFILNSGLNVTRIVGGNNNPLQQSSALTPISGYEFVEANAGTVRLSSPVQPDKDVEIVIHYRGKLTDMSWTDVSHVKETLTSDFTLIRPDAFAYPVISAPNKSAIAEALAQTPYFSTATVELASGYALAGNIHVNGQEVKGANISFDLKHNQATGPMILPIARYKLLQDGPVAISYFAGQESTASTLSSALAPEIAQLQNLLGKPSSSKLNIAMAPDGYGQVTTTGLIMMEEDSFTADYVKSSGALLSLWGVNSQDASGHWRRTFHDMIKLAATGGDLDDYSTTVFSAFKSALTDNTAIGKTKFEEFSEKGWTVESDAFVGLTLAGIRHLMGNDAFFAFVQAMHGELKGAYADNTVFADFVLEELNHKKARKFAQNWLTGKKAGKDLKKADDFAALMKRYR